MTSQEQTEIAADVKRTIATVCGMAETDLHGGTELIADLHLDSLALYEIVIELEERYSLQISDEDIDQVKSIDDIVSYLAKQMQQLLSGQ